MSFEWDKKKAAWYSEALKGSNFSEKAMELISGHIRAGDSVVDIGCGPGTLVLPISRLAATVTAVDPSAAMLGQLEQKLDGITNVTLVHSGFDTEIGFHDLMVSSNVFNLWAGDPEPLCRADRLFGKKIIILPAGLDRDKFYFKDLYPILYNEQFPPKDDYLKVYCKIHESVGACADVTVFDYRFDQAFRNIDEAVDFWQSYLPSRSPRHNVDNHSPELESRLRHYLESRLQKTESGFIAEFSKKAAMLCWS